MNTKKPAPMRHCFNCGEAIGMFHDYHPLLDTCGSRKCDRAARDAESEARDEAHEQLDRDMGWSDW